MKNRFVKLISSILFLSSFSFLSSCKKNENDEFTIFSINDLHGSLKESVSDSELGVAKLEYAIKHDIDYSKNSSIIIAVGDMFEGGYLAHEDKTLTDSVLASMGVEAMVLGNHDFSWGIATIKDLKAKAKYPYLACNIIDENGSHTNDISDDYTIIEKDGLKVGIIGCASAQSSILDSALNGYTFSTSLSYIGDSIAALDEKKCDIKIVAVHNSYTNKYVSSIAQTFNSTQIQGIFGAHTHKFEKETLSNSIPFLQGGCNSKGYCKMTFDKKEKKVKRFSYVNDCYNNYNNIEDSLLNNDIVSEISEADKKFYSDETICEFDSKFRRYNELNKFIPYVMIGEAKRLGWTSSNQFLAIHNLAGIRSDIPAGYATKETLFKTEPFDNKVKVILNVKGSLISSTLSNIESNYKSEHYAYMAEDEKEFSQDKVYDIITIDYVSESRYWPISNTQYDFDCQNNASDNKNNKVKYIFDAMIDFIKSEAVNGKCKKYCARDFR